VFPALLESPIEPPEQEDKASIATPSAVAVPTVAASD
jgi:hypothetical protein